MDLRQKIINDMVAEKVESEEIISLVMADSFHNINKATAFCSTIEVSGLGKFIFNKKKALKMLPNYKTKIPSTKSPEKLKALIETINYIESK